MPAKIVIEDECRCLCIILMLLAYAIAMPIALDRLYRFRNPSIEVVSVSVDPFNISSSSSSDSPHVTTKLNITFSVRNPNERNHTWYIHDTAATIFHREENISVTKVKPLLQDHLKTKSVQVSFGAVVLENDEYRPRGDILGFDVVLRGTVAINPWTNLERRRLMGATCKDIKVGFPSSSDDHATIRGSILLGGSRKCHVVLRGRGKIIFQ